MRNLKSQAERFYVQLFIAGLQSVKASASAYPNVEFKRDVQEIEHRVCHEGLQFLTRTVPSLAKAIDTALANDRIVQVRGFQLATGTQLPRFLGWLIRNVFNVDGSERSDACAGSLKWLRQVCYILYKLEVPTTKQQNEHTISSFVATDTSLPSWQGYTESQPRSVQHPLGYERRDYKKSRLLGDLPTRCSLPPVGESESADPHCTLGSMRMESPVFCGPGGRVPVPSASCRGSLVSPYRFPWVQQASILVKRVVGMLDPKAEPFKARHGTGSVSTGELPHEKAVFQRYFHDLHSVFPHGEYFAYNWSHYVDAVDVESMAEFRSGTAKVVLVPKDSRGPRLISCEPLEYQWIQQGLRRQLEKAIDDCPLTHGRINFRDQNVNRDLAMRGSRGEPWVTLDMKDASDRVSVALIQQLFPEPWLTCLMASRTPATVLPSGEVFQMRKFAPMGSSLCFPVESLVFWSLSIAAIMQTHKLTASQASTLMYVFGDDLIIRREVYQTVLDHLPLVDLKFNESKCCVAGSFRESCGCDAYKGVDVTPLRVKSTWDHRKGTSIASYVTLHNVAIERGLFNLADCIFLEITKYIKLPYAESAEVGYVCWVDYRKTAIQMKRWNKQFPRRYNRRFQCFQIRTWMVHNRPYRAVVPGWAEMLRVASYSVGSDDESDRCLAPAGDLVRDLPHQGNFKKFLPREPVVTAYQYAFPRRATLIRGWYPTLPSARE